MTPGSSRVLGAIAESAAEATGAEGVSLVGRDGEELRVLAVGGEHPGRSLGDAVAPTEESLGFVLASGQLLSLGPRPEESPARSAVLCVPCLGAEGVLGALELRGTQELEPFTPQAGHLAGLFADVAAVALEDAGATADPGPSAAEIGAELARLAEADPARYAAIASVIGALLAHG